MDRRRELDDSLRVIITGGAVHHGNNELDPSPDEYLRLTRRVALLFSVA